jgi:hypothetical protein
VLQKPSHQHYKGIMAVKIASKFHAREIRGLKWCQNDNYKLIITHKFIEYIHQVV